MNSRLFYLQEVMPAQIADQVRNRYSIEIRNIAIRYTEDPIELTTSLDIRFNYQMKDELHSSSVQLYGPREDLMRIEDIADKIAAKIQPVRGSA